MACPFVDEQLELTQPDGTLIPVRGWGNQDHAHFETLDGYTVVQNPSTQYWEFADLGEGAERYRLTGLLPLVANPKIAGLRPGLRLRSVGRSEVGQPSLLLEPHWKTRRALKKADTFHLNARVPLPGFPRSSPVVGDYVGLCLLVQFPDEPGAIPHEEVERFCNQEGYSGFGNHGSVRDYFLDNSIERLNYTTVVTPYYTSKHSRAYYADITVPYGVRARELVEEAIKFHLASGFDFGALSVDSSRNVYATNVFYAGRRPGDHAKGLWPHASRLARPLELAPGVRAYDYQITDLDNYLSLATYCHENGHMLCDFPDLYDTEEPGVKSLGAGTYCLMAHGSSASKFNPPHICAYLKREAGWANSVQQLNSGPVELAAGNNDFLIHTRSSTEYFIIENRFKVGRDQALPKSGLTIWHVDESGHNYNHEMTPDLHYECSLEQADGEFDLEHGKDLKDPNDIYAALPGVVFSDHTRPSSRWWDGTSSGLTLKEVGAAGQTIGFVVERA